MSRLWQFQVSVVAAVLLAGVAPDAAAQRPDASATARLLTLAGEVHSGTIETIDSAGVRLRQGRDTYFAPVDSLHRLRVGELNRSFGDEAQGRVALTDGCQMPVVGLSLEGAAMSLALPPPLSVDGKQSYEVPFEQVASFVFHVGPPELVEQWRRIVATDATADLIVVKRRDGQTLDFVEGIVTAVGPGSLTVDLDGDPVTVGRNRVYGVVCFRPDAARTPLLRVMAAGAELRGEQVVLDNRGRILVSLADGAEAAVPVGSLGEIDFSRGGVVLLSELEPLDAKWRPFFSPPGDLQLIEAWGRYRTDQAYSGDPLRVRSADGGLLQFTGGLAIRSYGEVTFAVPAGFSWLRATVGLDPKPTVRADATLRVLADGREVLVEEMSSEDAAIELSVPINGVGAVTLIVDFGKAVDAGDNVHLGNARFTK